MEKGRAKVERFVRVVAAFLAEGTAEENHGGEAEEGAGFAQRVGDVDGVGGAGEVACAAEGGREVGSGTGGAEGFGACGVAGDEEEERFGEVGAEGGMGGEDGGFVTGMG